ncbi:hypothetical protein [Hyalangium rubrum]|uniref:Cell surface protein n=1 Tax=Hyalangium rubrum TaxID=3103134 RepID=A0ABU5H3I2_9BACT|nr:hypothetical protein [Hyalangium sp. s54d21]MDY7227664.1 hypothetical protein [Hyalangium sp. s54d21]
MLRKLLGAGLLLVTLAGCTKLAEGDIECSTNNDCGEGSACDQATKLCYAVGTEPEETDGGCSFACASYEACTRSGCRARFTGVNFLSPTNNAVLDGGAVQVVAELVVNPTYATSTELPPFLSFGATRVNSGDIGPFSNQSRDGGTYSITWQPPAAQDQFTVTAAYPVTDAGVSGSVTVTVDSVAPTFTINLSNPPPRAEPSATQADQRDLTAGFEAAFRRDESVVVTVSSTETVNSVALTLVGIGPGNTPGQEMEVPLQIAGGCEGAPAFCASATVNLSVPEMRAFRGTMELRVKGQDGAGNEGTATRPLKVTRWKWGFAASANILSTPAVGAQGVVYFGTNTTTGTGKTVAIDPEGKRKWETSTGDVTGSPAVGVFASDEEYVYVTAKSGSSPLLYGIRGSSGAIASQCTPSGSGSLVSAVAVGSTSILGVPRETGFSIYNASGSQGRIIGVRPTAVLAEQCVEASGGSVPPSTTGSAVVIKDSNVFYGTNDFKVTSFDLSTLANTPRAGWPQSTTYFARGLAVLGDTLYGGASSENPAQGALFSVATSGGGVSVAYPSTATSRVFNLAIGTGNTAYFGAETSSAQELLSLTVQPLSTAPSARAASNGTLRGAPVIAENDRLYTFSTSGTTGRVAAWVASTLAPQWELEDIPVQDNVEGFVSPTLDCHRGPTGQVTAGLGTLYIAAATKLYAFVVDSPGLDSAAPWPKYQRDPRNTGNAATTITNCP